jgi:hypothetical protein
MENKNLKQELEWIDKNPQYYKNAQHQEDVKHNITVNYEIRELESQLNIVAIHERAALELRIGDLKDSRREVDLKYCSIKCPPIPKTKDELKNKVDSSKHLSNPRRSPISTKYPVENKKIPL